MIADEPLILTAWAAIICLHADHLESYNMKLTKNADFAPMKHTLLREKVINLIC